MCATLPNNFRPITQNTLIFVIDLMDTVKPELKITHQSICWALAVYNTAK